MKFTFFADAKTKESLTLRIFDPDYLIPLKQMTALLKRANLESHGYRMENTTKLVSESGIDNPLYQQSYFYYKIVNCSRAQEITKELQSLLPGEHSIRLFRDEIYQTSLKAKRKHNPPPHTHTHTHTHTPSPPKKKLVKISQRVFFLEECNQINFGRIFSWPFSGAVGVELVTMSNNEFKARNVTSMKQCKMGLEVHIKEDVGYRDDKNITRCRRKRRSTDPPAKCCCCCCRCEAQ